MNEDNKNDLSGEIILDDSSENTSEKRQDVEKKKDIEKPIEEKQTTETLPEVAPTTDKPVEKKAPNLFTAFCHYPKGIRFASQEKDEEIILLIRRSFVTNVPWMLLVLLLALLPIILIPFYQILLPLDQIGVLSRIFLVIFYYILLLGFVVLKFALWFYHVSYMTNLRIIDFDVHGILLRDVSETRLKLVQEVNYNQSGFFHSLFNFGEVRVQTAGTVQNIEFDKAPKPAQIARIIGDKIGKRVT